MGNFLSDESSSTSAFDSPRKRGKPSVWRLSAHTHIIAACTLKIIMLFFPFQSILKESSAVFMINKRHCPATKIHQSGSIVYSTCWAAMNKTGKKDVSANINFGILASFLSIDVGRILFCKKALRASFFV